MSNGGLNGQLVVNDFWPSCQTCACYADCNAADKAAPRYNGWSMGARHQAFPHTWHWGAEAVDFPEGRLVLVSWVGASEIGAKHTGCYSYSVERRYLLPLQDKHLQYLELEAERQATNRALEEYERRGVYNKKVQALYARDEAILREQEQLCEGWHKPERRPTDGEATFQPGANRGQPGALEAMQAAGNAGHSERGGARHK